MTEFLEMYGADIAAIVIAVCGGITAIATMIKSFKSNREFRKDVEITQEGIKQGFQIFADKKLEITIGKKFDEKLEWFKNELYKDIKNQLFELKDNEQKRLRLQYFNAKILSNTQAFKKLTTEEQNEVRELIAEFDNNENVETIEIQGE